jgi:hypothetical protein
VNVFVRISSTCRADRFHDRELVGAGSQDAFVPRKALLLDAACT